MGCVCSTPGDDRDRRAFNEDVFTGPSRNMLARRKPRVLAVIAAWRRPENKSLPRTRSQTTPSVLSEVAGHPVVYHAWFAANSSKCVSRCVVATDDEEVDKAAVAFGAQVVRTDEAVDEKVKRNESKKSDTEKKEQKYSAIRRASFAYSKAKSFFFDTNESSRDFDVVVVVDADELFVEAHHIEITADAVINSEACSATSTRMRSSDISKDERRAFCAVDGEGYVKRVFTDESSDDGNGQNAQSTDQSSDAESLDSPTSPLGGDTNGDALFLSKQKTETVVVEVGVRAYTARCLSQFGDGSNSKKKDRDKSPKKYAVSDEVSDDLLAHDPTFEALRLGWMVKSVKSSDKNLGGLKTQRSLDAVAAGIGSAGNRK